MKILYICSETINVYSWKWCFDTNMVSCFTWKIHICPLCIQTCTNYKGTGKRQPGLWGPPSAFRYSTQTCPPPHLFLRPPLLSASPLLSSSLRKRRTLLGTHLKSFPPFAHSRFWNTSSFRNFETHFIYQLKKNSSLRAFINIVKMLIWSPSFAHMHARDCRFCFPTIHISYGCRWAPQPGFLFV